MKKSFINYAHRGASEYAPENTLLSFYLGVYMGANGIETDVQLTKDNVAVLFHDDTLKRVTNEEGSIGDYTLAELKNFWVYNKEIKDKIITLEEFLVRFGVMDLTLAIELKGDNTAKITTELVEKYNLKDKVVLTSFKYKEILDAKKFAPHIKAGYLANKVDDELLEKMKEDKIEELCPEAKIITPTLCKKWHDLGFNVRAWGVSNTDYMKSAYISGVDGMTVNFPDKLQKLLDEAK